ncbi:hypothetical protein, conserved [Eimeria brunetti]|uniref:Uncharacterized protein n=1 Tax=Eimeria brunetti TaxID=51314 RepID=U6LG29_9EIME|nr:hypothetical protein, conserved [Eimeria brunetti]
MRNLIACAVIFAAAPVNAGGGAAENAPNGWPSAGPLTNEVGIQTPPRKPLDGFSLAGRPNDSSSPESIANVQQLGAEDIAVLQPRLPSGPPTEQIQQEGGQSELEAPRSVSSGPQREKKLWEDGPTIVSLGLFVVMMAFITKAFSSRLASKGGAEASPAERPQAQEGSVRPESEATSAEELQRDMETPPAEDSGIEGVTELLDSISDMVSSFRRALLRAEVWANRAESVLLSSRTEERDFHGMQSASSALTQKMSSIAHSLAENAGPVCNGLESLTGDIRKAKTGEEAWEVAGRLRQMLRALESIGDSSTADFHKVVKLTVILTSEARVLLDIYPDVLVLANNMSEPLAVSATGHNQETSVANLRKLVDAVSVKEALQQAKLKKILQRSLSDPQFAHLFHLLWKSQEQQGGMSATLKSLAQAQRSLEEGKLPFDRLNIEADAKMLNAIKAKQVALGEEMKMELDTCVFRALEKLEAGRVLLERGTDARWKKNAHPLVGLARTIRKHISAVEVSLSKWEENSRNQHM